MKRKNSQLGSLHAVIIVVLFIALMATLGIVFYQNFVAKKPDTSEQVKKPVVVAPVETTTRVAFNSDVYALDHPSDWKATTTKRQDIADGGGVSHIKSPDGTAEVLFDVSALGLGYSCDQASSLKISSYKVQSAVNAKLTDQSLSLVESIFDYEGGGYQYRIGLTQDGGDTHAAIGDAYCNVNGVGIASTVSIDNSNSRIVKPTIIARINFLKLPATDKPAAKDMQTIKNLMNTSSYKEAVKILESARKE